MYLKVVNPETSANKKLSNQEIIFNHFCQIKKKKCKPSFLGYSFLKTLEWKEREVTLADFKYVAKLLKYNPKWAEIKFKEYQTKL